MYQLVQKTSWFTLLMGLSLLVMAQNPPMTQQPGPISDEELKTFIAVSQDLQVLNQSLQSDMASTIQAEGMDLETFQNIQQQMQASGGNAEVEGVSQEEMSQFKAILQKLQGMQMEAQNQMTQDMKAAGITMDRYRQIGSALQGNEKLQQRAQELQMEMQTEEK